MRVPPSLATGRVRLPRVTDLEWTHRLVVLVVDGVAMPDAAFGNVEARLDRGALAGLPHSRTSGACRPSNACGSAVSTLRVLPGGRSAARAAVPLPTSGAVTDVAPRAFVLTTPGAF